MYKGKSDVGYYLGAKFIQYICKTYNFEEIISFEIDLIEEFYLQFLES